MKLKVVSPLRLLVLSLLVIASVFPIYYILVNSLKTRVQYAQNQIAPPADIQWANYGEAWEQVARPILNSSMIVLASLAGILLCASLSAYAFALIPFPGKRILFLLVFVLLLIPSFLTLIPLYLQIKKLPISDTYWALILPYVAIHQAFSIFVLKAFFEGISKDLLEAARIDGASDLRIYRSIAVPLALPVLISVGMIALIPMWNDYLLPQLLLDRAHQTITVALVAFQGNAQTHTAPNFGPLMASYVLAAIPLLLLFSFLMRYYVQGLTSGAMKM